MSVQTRAKADGHHQLFSLYRVLLAPKIECGSSEPWVFREKESVLPGSWDSVNNENVNYSRNPFRFQVRKQELPLLKSSEALGGKALSLESSH